jgi:hypothetical protein
MDLSAGHPIVHACFPYNLADALMRGCIDTWITLKTVIH